MPEELIYRLAKKSDAPDVLNFLLEHYFPLEPCTRALKLIKSEAEVLYESLVARCLQFPFSTVVTTQSGEIVACLVNSAWKRDDNAVEGADYEVDEGLTENMTAFIKMLNTCHEDFWNLAPQNINVVLHREVSSVSEKYQRRGIATKMLTTNMPKAKLDEYSIDGVLSETCSFGNQVLLEKHGFKCLKTIPYTGIVDSQGNQILKTDDGSTELKLNFKLIGDFEILD
ncbi:aralkylamine N-acetyltransferase [Caenorhabditis elegans]|uniref:aralkylamine N-acetyltransferase n=1 Tax=Caenorhabditis elegans TaxID=6239 RepID=Q7YTM1_CAEEL|nr:N-acetyltransferase domain-containing protein [Caenorhabditis elegans]CAE17866.1 N-acetyltransferase domain-containing protein [Caenorhabditis elegans]|eukprot:NP_001022271.1 Uncharacterized protein CELE_R05H10.7 [Caenorhabditis elegans]